MTTRNNPTASTTAEKDFVITRLLDAPRTLVFKAWTDPEHVKQWWGPHHFSCPICQIDLKVGSAYRFVMRGPDGTDYPMGGVYREIVVPERLVFTIKTNEHPPEWHEML